jgi:predicted nucleic-acid-binding protein
MTCKECDRLKIELSEAYTNLDNARSKLHTEIKYHKESTETQLMIIDRLKEDNRLLVEHREMLTELLNTYIRNEMPITDALNGLSEDKLGIILEIIKHGRKNV